MTIKDRQLIAEKSREFEMVNEKLLGQIKDLEPELDEKKGIFSAVKSLEEEIDASLAAKKALEAKLEPENRSDAADDDHDLSPEPQSGGGPIFSFRRMCVIGLDIGEASIKAVRARKTSAGPKIMVFAQQSIPPEVRTKKKARAAFIKEALTKMFSETRFRTRWVVCSVPRSAMHVNFLSLPEMSESDLKGALEMELRKNIPFELEDAVYDYTILNNNNEEGQIDIVVSVVQKEKMEELMDIVEGSGLLMAGINVAPFALENLIASSGLLKAKGTVALLDIGYGGAGINFFSGGKLQFARSVGGCGREIIDALARKIVVKNESVELTSQEVEEIIRKYNIIDPGDEIVKEIVPVSQLSMMVRPVIERLVSEVKRSLAYYKQVKETQVERIVLAGGVSKLKGLSQHLRDELDVQVENLGAAANIPSEPDISNMALAVGLSLDKDKKINLLSRESRVRNAVIRVRPFYETATFSAVIVLLALLSATMFMSNKFEKLHLPQVQEELKFIEQGARKSREYDGLVKALDHKRVRLRKVARAGLLWEGILKELSRIVPSEMVLTEISPEDGPSRDSRTLFIKGLICSERKNRVLSEFMSSLNASPFFGDIPEWELKPFLPTVDSPRSSDDPQAIFEMKCVLVY